MQTTDYHAKYFAYKLTKRCPSDSVEKFTAALMDSRVELKPHQVDAALFAFRSPLSKGAILADEVGLGKTIEAGIVLSQKWAERKRKILIITPSSLRMQWGQELADKFYLPSTGIDSRIFKQAITQGSQNPFVRDDIIICSYSFARNKSAEIVGVNWDLVVIDEAHRLRNVYKPSNVIANELKKCLAHAPKLLLTATPLQNSLMELYGLVSFIDEYSFGDQKSFRAQFARITSGSVYADLRERLKPICKRTLRRQVLEYINYTARIAHTQYFEPTADEDALYELVSEYLRRENLQALPKGQRNLMILVMRKLLASSSFAIAGALYALAQRLKARLKEDLKFGAPPELDLAYEYETLPEVADEWDVDPEPEPERLSEKDKKTIRLEIAELESFYELAVGITENAKGTALLDGLRVGFAMTAANGGKPKALIFTESRRTQNYLAALLADNGYDGKVVLFNGSNNDENSRAIYNVWKLEHKGTDRISGVRAADTRAAIVDFFRNQAQIMIATEAAAEGINLQFCSFVVNYDLPWNPQRIEQQIGRCHRYGQKYDVVVVNFLNPKNAADQRVYELLDEKFRLFSGVFGVSDEVLGSIESGVDFEKRIVEIYQTCRHPDEIKASFDALQAEMGATIDGTMRKTRQKLLENFDSEVAEKLNVYEKESLIFLNKYESLLWNLTRHALAGAAEFDDEHLIFSHAGDNYCLKPGNASREEHCHHYRLQHPLAQRLVEQAKVQKLPAATIRFDYSNSGKKIAVLKSLIGQKGVLAIRKLTVHALETEDYLLFAGISDNGKELEPEQCRRLFDLPGAIVSESVSYDPTEFEVLLNQRQQDVLREISTRNAEFFDEEMEKLDKWADDVKHGLEIQLKHLDIEIKTHKAEARKIADLQKKVAAQRRIKDMEKKRSKLRRNLFDEQDKIDQRKDDLLEIIESRMSQKTTMEVILSIEWELK